MDSPKIVLSVSIRVEEIKFLGGVSSEMLLGSSFYVYLDIQCFMIVGYQAVLAAEMFCHLHCHNASVLCTTQNVTLSRFFGAYLQCLSRTYRLVSTD